MSFGFPALLPARNLLSCLLLAPVVILAPVTMAVAQTPPPLSERAKSMDADNNGLISKQEAMGPLAANFDDIDCDKNGALDGGEIPAFFQGRDCPDSGNANEPEGSSASSASGNRSARGAPKTSGRPPQAVKLGEVRLETTSETYTVIGRIVARQSGPLAARISGAVETVHAEVGDHVKRGDLIVSLSKDRLLAERQRLLAQVERHRVLLANAQRELRRMQKLIGTAAFSESNIENQQGLVDERRAQLAEFNAATARLDIDIEDTAVKAPYDAVVLARHVEAGGFVNTGSPVVTLLNDNSLEVEADIPAFRIVGLQADTQATVITEADRRFSARVRAVIPSDNTRSRSRPVRLSVDFGADAIFLANNQSVSVELPLTQGNRILTVPKDAVVRRANGDIVFVVNDNNATMRFVTLGRGVDDKFQVLNGLEVGERVVVRGNEGLGAGGRVRIIE